MRILIDIGHPAHVHYFRNFIQLMQAKGHEFFISARDKEVIHILLEKYNIPFYNRGKGADGMRGKFLYIFRADILLLKKAMGFKPDLFLSFASPYAAHVSWLLGKPHIVLDDTESASLNHKLYLPFSKVAMNPDSFRKNMGSKQVRFDSFMELSYLSPTYFKPSVEIFQYLGIQPDQKYCIIRFVSWNANHDVGQKGLDYELKIKLIEMLSKVMTVFISSEGALPAKLQKYQIRIPPEKLHDALAFAHLYIGEGATTASECVMLGTPAIYINSLSAGTLEEQARLGLLYNFRDPSQLFPTLEKILSHPNYKKEIQQPHKKLLLVKIDITAFLVWFIENYPASVQTMKETPEYQYRFLVNNLND